MPIAFFDESTNTWNLNHLDNILNDLDTVVPGVNSPYLYFGMWKATFAWHVEVRMNKKVKGLKAETNRTWTCTLLITFILVHPNSGTPSPRCTRKNLKPSCKVSPMGSWYAKPTDLAWRRHVLYTIQALPRIPQTQDVHHLSSCARRKRYPGRPMCTATGRMDDHLSFWLSLWIQSRLELCWKCEFRTGFLGSDRQRGQGVWLYWGHGHDRCQRALGNSTQGVCLVSLETIVRVTSTWLLFAFFWHGSRTQGLCKGDWWNQDHASFSQRHRGYTFQPLEIGKPPFLKTLFPPFPHLCS